MKIENILQNLHIHIQTYCFRILHTLYVLLLAMITLNRIYYQRSTMSTMKIENLCICILQYLQI